MTSELRFETKKIRIADLGQESCVPDLLDGLTMQNSLEFHLDETDEIYEGYGRVKSAYPYRQRNTYTRKLKEQEVQTAVLENRYLKAVFLPGFGGRLWELWDKYTGKNLGLVKNNLRKLVELRGYESIVVRVPEIPEFADKSSQMQSRHLLQEMGIAAMDLFKYHCWH